VRIALGLEYDGSAFCGWQTQPGACGVQDHLQQALRQFTQQDVEAVAAGRTDAGVHASAQVVHLDANVEREPHSWVRGTNSNLHPSARVLWASPMPDDFHARYSARARTYRYLLVNTPVAPAILKGKAGWHHRPLDAARMHAAAQVLVGEHDFSAFRDAECQAKSPVRTLSAITIARHDSLISFTLRANAFLHHMVRNIVGSLAYVGDGRQPQEWIAQLLDSRDRRHAAPTFMPDGLYLAGIEYDQAFTLPAFPANPLVHLP
jgi:tRNA pseudouridine38-40 synthase